MAAADDTELCLRGQRVGHCLHRTIALPEGQRGKRAKTDHKNGTRLELTSREYIARSADGVRNGMSRRARRCVLDGDRKVDQFQERDIRHLYWRGGLLLVEMIRVLPWARSPRTACSTARGRCNVANGASSLQAVPVPELFNAREEGDGAVEEVACVPDAAALGLDLGVGEQALDAAGVDVERA